MDGKGHTATAIRPEFPGIAAARPDALQGRPRNLSKWTRGAGSRDFLREGMELAAQVARMHVQRAARHVRRRRKRGLPDVVTRALPLGISLTAHLATFLTCLVVYAGATAPARHLKAAPIGVLELLSTPIGEPVEAVAPLAPADAAIPNQTADLLTSHVYDPSREELLDVGADEQPLIGLGVNPQQLVSPWESHDTASATLGFNSDTTAPRPQEPFRAAGSTAMRVIFLCDASGSMIPNFFNLQDELAEAVNKLRPYQSFNVIFFTGSNIISLGPHPVPASTSNKHSALALTKRIRAEGLTNPIPAIDAAFAQRPDMICVITDGFDNADSPAPVIDAFRRSNRFTKATINTVLVRGSSDPQLEETLRQIAQENGGGFKAIQNK